MFPSVKTRFTSAARRGFDLAIEFATLGEYAVALAPAPGSRADMAESPSSPAARAVPIRLRPSRVKPATPAARRLQPVQRERRISTRTAVRALAFDGSGPEPPRRESRTRAGAPTPRPQRCVVAEAGGRQR
jgi:hypothetical protein